MKHRKLSRRRIVLLLTIVLALVAAGLYSFRQLIIWTDEERWLVSYDEFSKGFASADEVNEDATSREARLLIRDAWRRVHEINDKLSYPTEQRNYELRIEPGFGFVDIAFRLSPSAQAENMAYWTARRVGNPSSSEGPAGAEHRLRYRSNGYSYSGFYRE